MQVLHIIWQYGEPVEGGTRVFETEHLFGYDVIFVVDSHDKPIPIVHITSNRQMTAAERIIARKACGWRDAERYDIFTSMVQHLQEGLVE